MHPSAALPAAGPSALPTKSSGSHSQRSQHRICRRGWGYVIHTRESLSALTASHLASGPIHAYSIPPPMYTLTFSALTASHLASGPIRVRVRVRLRIAMGTGGLRYNHTRQRKPDCRNLHRNLPYSPVRRPMQSCPVLDKQSPKANLKTSAKHHIQTLPSYEPTNPTTHSIRFLPFSAILVHARGGVAPVE